MCSSSLNVSARYLRSVFVGIHVDEDVAVDLHIASKDAAASGPVAAYCLPSGLVPARATLHGRVHECKCS